MSLIASILAAAEGEKSETPYFIAGGLFAHLQGMVRPDDFKFDRSIDVIVMIIVGGLGSISGAVLGAFVITILLELLRATGEARLIVYPLILILTILLRPQGVLGRRELPFGKLLARFRKTEPTK